MQNTIELVTFDLDNTLWDVTATIVAAEQKLRSWMQENTPEALAIYASSAIADIRESVLEDYPNQRHDLSFLRIEVLRRCMLAAAFSPEKAKHAADQAFEVFFAGRNEVVFFENALEVLQELSKHYPLYALTNGNASIERVGIDPFFSGAVSSADVGASKPDLKMFTTVLEKAGVEAAQAVHIGDHLSDDVAGANAAGMWSIWFNKDGAYENDSRESPSKEVQSLDQLPAVIASLASVRSDQTH